MFGPSFCPDACCGNTTECDIVADFDHEITDDDPLTVAFTDTSTSSCEIKWWFWKFGDGESSTEQNPTHVYAEPGVYTVQLQSVDDCGCHSNKFQTIHGVDCDPADPVVAEDCEDFVEKLKCMWAIVRLELSANDGACGCYRWSGDYFYDPADLPGVWGPSTPAYPTADPEEFAARNDCGPAPYGLDFPHTIGDRGDFSIQLYPDCVETDRVVFTVERTYLTAYNFDPLLVDLHDVFRAVTAEIDTTTPIESGLTFSLTDDGYTSSYGPNECHVDSATITFVGRPCESEPCTNGPTAGFTLTRLNHCTYAVTNTSTAGDCPIAECYWSDGFVGCDRSENPIDLNAGCTTADREVSLLVVDEKGCVDTHAETVSCCACSHGECGMEITGASFTVTSETLVEPNVFQHCIEFTIQWKAFNDCGVRVGLYLNDSGGDPVWTFGTIINPGDPEESQTAEAVVEFCNFFFGGEGDPEYISGCLFAAAIAIEGEFDTPTVPTPIPEYDEFIALYPGACTAFECAPFGDDDACCEPEA